MSAGGIIFCHATEPFREGKRTVLTKTDINRLKVPEELIDGARRDGAKFLEYYYDDPTVEGDEDTGSSKFGYAVSFPGAKTTQRVVVGSGIYLGNLRAGPDAD